MISGLIIYNLIIYSRFLNLNKINKFLIKFNKQRLPNKSFL